MKTAIGLLLALSMFPAAAQDYRLPPSMRGPAEKPKPEVDYRLPGTATPAGSPPITQFGGPYVKIHNLRCSAGRSNGVATGAVENISKQPLNHVEVAVSWGGVRHPPVVLKPMPMKPGDRLEFEFSGPLVQAGIRDCAARVTVK